MIVFLPLTKTPLFSASRIIRNAILSFKLPPAEKASTFATVGVLREITVVHMQDHARRSQCMPLFSAILCSRIRGVLPIKSKLDSNMPACLMIVIDVQCTNPVSPLNEVT